MMTYIYIYIYIYIICREITRETCQSDFPNSFFINFLRERERERESEREREREIIPYYKQNLIKMMIMMLMIYIYIYIYLYIYIYIYIFIHMPQDHKGNVNLIFKTYSFFISWEREWERGTERERERERETDSRQRVREDGLEEKELKSIVRKEFLISRLYSFYNIHMRLIFFFNF